MKQAMTLNEKQLKSVLAYTATRRHAARDRAIVMVSYLAGLRAKEIAALTIDNVRDDTGSIREEFVLMPEQTKGRKSRRVFLSTRLRKELDAYIKGTKLHSRNPSLFQSQKGGSFSGNTMCQLFLDIYAACGLDGASSHSGRRTLLTALAAKGVGVRVLQEIAGHSSIAVTQRYLDVMMNN
jgi:integrase/recombinase XerD